MSRQKLDESCKGCGMSVPERYIGTPREYCDICKYHRENEQRRLWHLNNPRGKKK